MKTFPIIVLALLCLCIAGKDRNRPPFSFKRQSEPVSIGEQVKGSIRKISGGESVILLNTAKVISTDFLFFSVELDIEDEWQNIKMTVSQKTGTQILKCESTAIDSCYIKGDKLGMDQSLMVKISCEEDCSYKFNTYWTSLKKIKMDQTLQLHFESLGIGQFIEFVSESDTNRLQFIVEPNDKNLELDRVQILGSVNGVLPSEQSHDFSSVPLWGKGHGIFIKSKDIVGKKLILLVLGQPEVSYTLKCLALTEDFRNIQLGKSAHDYLSGNQIHKFQLPIQFNKDDNEEEIFCLDITIFIGQLSIGIYKDKEGTIEFQTKPMIYKGSSRYIFSETDLITEKIQNLFVIFKSVSTPTTYSLNIAKQYFNQATQLKHQIYQFMKVNSQKLLYIKVQQWGFHINSQPKDLVLKILTGGLHSPQILFRICLKSIHQCTAKTTLQASTRILESVAVTTSQQQTTYRIKLNPKTYFNMLGEAENNIIIVEFNKAQDQSNFVVAYYSDENQIYSLKKDQKLQKNLQLGETKYFYFKPTQNIKKVRVHCVVMTGNIEVKSARKDPRSGANVNMMTTDLNDIEFNQNLDQPFFLIVNALSESSFVFITKTTTQDDKQLSNSNIATIHLLEDKQYTFYTNAGDSQIFQIKPSRDGLLFNYESSGEIMACFIKTPNQKCNDKQTPIIGNKDIFDYKDAKANQMLYLRVLNTNHKKLIQTTLYFHSGPKLSCNPKKIGKVYSDIISGDFCIKYQITDSEKDMEGFFMRTEMDEVKLNILVCDSPIDNPTARFQISHEIIKQKCSTTKQKTISLVSSDANKNTKDIKVQYLLRDKNQPLELPDGIGFKEYAKASSDNRPIAKYYYYLLNKVTTQILIHNKLGGVQAYARIVEEGKEQKTQVTNTLFDMTTQQSYLYLSGPEIIIKKEYLDTLKCKDCVVVIATYADSDIEEFGDVSYTIQATQNTVLLNQHQIHASFLYKDTITYFRYECSKIGSTIMFDLTDHHMECARIYASDKQYPSFTNKIDMVWGNELTLECKERNYYFAVQAIKNCPISVVVQGTDYKLTKIMSGMPIQFNLKPKQVQYFSYLHTVDKPFKIVSLEKYGNVQIFGSEATVQILETLKTPNPQFTKFPFKSYNKNVLTINKESTGYCFHCIYLIAISSQQNVQSVLFLLDSDDQPVLLTPQNVISDELQPTKQMQLIFFDVLRGNIIVNVYQGSIDLTLNYLQKQTTWSLKAQNQTKINNYDFRNPKINYDWDPIYLTIQNNGKGIAQYSLHINKDENPEVNSFLIKSGVASFVSIREKDTFCLKGFFAGLNQKIHISISKQNQELLKNVIPELTVNQKKTLIKHTIIQNMMEIFIQSQETLLGDPENKFMLCLENSGIKRAQMKVVQSGEIDQLALNTWAMTTTDHIYTVRPKKQALFDILPCHSLVNYMVDLDFNSLSDPERQSLQLDSVDKQVFQPKQNNHVVYYESDSEQIFIKISSTGSLVKWLEVDEEKQMGMGYMNYGIGEISEFVETDEILINWDPIKSLKDSKTKIISVRYRVFIARSPIEAKIAANCQLMSEVEFFMLESNFNGSEHETTTRDNNRLGIVINKKEIRENFKQTRMDQNIFNLYITLSADLTLQVPSDPPIFEQYRFIYNQIQLPRTLILNDGETQRNYTSLGLMIGGIALGVVGVIFVSYMVLKKLVPLISRLKNRMLMEQQEVRNGDSAPSVDVGGGASDKKIIADEDI